MNENNSAGPGDVAPGSDAHEALIRRQAAAQMLAYGDRARALGIDIDDVAAGLMAAADKFARNDAPPMFTEADLDFYGLGYSLGRAGWPEGLLDQIGSHFLPLFSEGGYVEMEAPTFVDGWYSGAADLRQDRAG